MFRSKYTSQIPVITTNILAKIGGDRTDYFLKTTTSLHKCTHTHALIFNITFKSQTDSA